MGDPTPIDMSEYVNYILHNFTFSTWTHADRVLKKHYETVFGIFDHRPASTKGSRPFSGQAAVDGNTMGEDKFLGRIFDDYIDKGIHSATQMGFETYLTLSREQRMLIDARCKKKREQDAIEATTEARIQEKTLKDAITPKVASPGARPQNMNFSR